jgi:tripartite-type tricarboxylate transporter receptor subunit TctC
MPQRRPETWVPGGTSVPESGLADPECTPPMAEPSRPKLDPRTRCGPRRVHPGALGRAALGLALWLGVAAARAAPGPAMAPPFPARPVHIVVPYAAGGAVDAIARVLADALAGRLGQPILIDDKPGASGNLGMAWTAHAPADGYTLLLASNGLATNPSLFAHPGFDPRQDFSPLGRIGHAPLVVVAPPAAPYATIAALVSAARAAPGQLSYGTPGNGSSGHLAGELLKMRAGIDLAQVPYKGGAPALADLLGGRIDVMLHNPVEVITYIQAGRVRALAVTDTRRLALLPEVPTLAEAGIGGCEASVWWGLVAPARTPVGTTRILAEALDGALHEPALRTKLAQLGVIVDPQDAAGFARFIEDQAGLWAQVIRRAGIHAD